MAAYDEEEGHSTAAGYCSSLYARAWSAPVRPPSLFFFFFLTRLLSHACVLVVNFAKEIFSFSSFSSPTSDRMWGGGQEEGFLYSPRRRLCARSLGPPSLGTPSWLRGCHRGRDRGCDCERRFVQCESDPSPPQLSLLLLLQPSSLSAAARRRRRFVPLSSVERRRLLLVPLK